jgi:hypothetical protein
MFSDLSRFLFQNLLLLLFSYSLYSQSATTFFNKAIWYKSHDSNSYNFKGISKKENDLYSLFNFNRTIDFKKEKIDKIVRGIVENKSSFFIVFKSEEVKESNLFILKQGGFETFFTTGKVYTDEEEFKHKEQTRDGVILTYIYNKNNFFSKKKGSIVFDDILYNDKEGKNAIMELIYFPKVVSTDEKNRIESYLSLKYGISLCSGSDYYNSNGDLVWEHKKNENYGYRITGIGRDDSFQLYQKQSGNYKKDGLYIGFDTIFKRNEDNLSKIKDKTFLIWGDNNGTTHLKEDNHSITSMSRKWKTQFIREPGDTVTNPKIQVKIDTDLMNFGKLELTGKDNRTLWMVVDTLQGENINYSRAIFLKPLSQDLNFLYDASVINKYSSCLFTFVSGSDFFVLDESYASQCMLNQKGGVRIKIIGGVAPYLIKLQSDKFYKEIAVADSYLEIESLSDGDYLLEVLDSKKKSHSSSFSIDGFLETPVSLSKEWLLSQGETLVVKPTIDKQEQIMSYSWYNENKLLGIDNQITINEIGNYSLEVEHNNGCRKKMDFSVKAKEKSPINDWIVFPNPVKSNEKFSIRFNLSEPEDIVVNVYDENGRNLRTKQLGTIKQFDYNDSLLVSGTYLIVVTRKNTSQTAKIIIQ